MRVIALYIQHRDGVPDEDRRRLYQHARLSLAEQDAVNALALLGVELAGYALILLHPSKHCHRRIYQGPNDRDIKKKIKQKPKDDEYELSRFKPLLKTVIEVCS